MIIDKSKTINIPVWLVSVVLPLIIGIITSYGIMTSTAATQRTKIENIEKTIDKLDQQKVDSQVFDMVIKKLDSIDKKLDMHINQKS